MHKTLLSAVAAIGLLLPAGYASAQDSRSVNINTEVTAHCGTLEANPTPIDLGELSDSNGFLDPGVLNGDEGHTFPAFWCNSPAEISLTASPLVNSGAAPTTDTAFTDTVNFVATLNWNGVTGSDNSAAPGATDINSTNANTGDLSVLVTSLDAGALKLLAGDYSGSITVTVNLP